jgi:hypothetical protein
MTRFSKISIGHKKRARTASFVVLRALRTVGFFLFTRTHKLVSGPPYKIERAPIGQDSKLDLLPLVLVAAVGAQTYLARFLLS